MEKVKIEITAQFANEIKGFTRKQNERERERGEERKKKGKRLKDIWRMEEVR